MKKLTPARIARLRGRKFLQHDYDRSDLSLHDIFVHNMMLLGEFIYDKGMTCGVLFDMYELSPKFVANMVTGRCSIKDSARFDLFDHIRGLSLVMRAYGIPSIIPFSRRRK